MDAVLMIVLGLIAVGAVTVAFLLARRDARARRFDALPGTDRYPRERVDADAAAGGAHLVRGGGNPL